MRARRHAGLVAAGLATALALAGCMGMPTSGPVEGGDVVVPEPENAIPIPSGPVEGATPEVIVKGFLAAAAAGVYDDFETAKSFLTAPAAQKWRPQAATTLYLTQDPTVRIAQAERSASVTVEPVGTVDDAGRYTEEAEGASLQLPLTLAQVRGEWRISGLPDGILMSLNSFQGAHRPVRIYFASPDGRQLIPEQRWFLASRVVPEAAKALVDGPSPWLRDGVTTGVPEGVRLLYSGITLEDTVLTVGLASDIGKAPDVEQRNLLQAQLEATMASANTGVTDIKVTINDQPWEPSGVPDLVVDPAPSRGPYVLARDDAGSSVLAEVVDGKVVPVADAAPLGGLLASSPAVSQDGTVRVVLDAGHRLVLVPPDGAQLRTLVDGTALLAPSVDRFDWAWTGERSSAGTLVAVSAAGERVPVAADWLSGRQVRSVRVARDGARVAVAYQNADGRSVVEVAAVVRDAQGKPQRLSGDRLVVGASLTDVTEVSWLDETRLAVLGVGPAGTTPSAYYVPLGGPSEGKATQSGLANIAAMPDRLYAADDEGRLLRFQLNTWAEVAEGVRDPAFPG